MIHLCNINKLLIIKELISQHEILTVRQGYGLHYGKEDAADFGAETDRVSDQGTESVQAGGVVTPGNPEFQVAAVSVFGFQVLFRPGYQRFQIHFRITALPILESTADDGFPINDTVSFSDHLPVYGTGFRFSRSPVVFRGLCYGFYLPVIKPLPQPFIGTYDFPRVQMVVLPAVISRTSRSISFFTTSGARL